MPTRPIGIMAPWGIKLLCEINIEVNRIYVPKEASRLFSLVWGFCWMLTPGNKHKPI